MKPYTVIATAKQQNAIGKPEKFTLTVDTDTRRDAYKQARTTLYAQNYEQVQIKSIDGRLSLDDITL